MANQSVATPRFYLDFTQLAKAKGYVEDDTDQAYNVLDENGNLDQNNEKNNNVWDYDYTKTTNFTVQTSAIQHFTFLMPAFWRRNENVVSNNVVLEWAKLISTSNYAGVINHNLYTAVDGQSPLSLVPYFSSGLDHTWISPITDIANTDNGVLNDGYSFVEFPQQTARINAEESEDIDIDLQNHRFSQFRLKIQTNNNQVHSSNINFDIGAITFGKYIDMPHSPDLSVKKSVEYDGVNVKRSLGGADYVQVNHQGQPDWLVGEPWTLKNYPSNGRVGRNGRRSWDLDFSYISNDDLFYDLSERVVGGSATMDGDTEQFFDSTSEIQQIWDLTLGGALSFVFCPDKDATNLEFAVCRLDKDSLVATQVAYQTWNISMSVVEVW